MFKTYMYVHSLYSYLYINYILHSLLRPSKFTSFYFPSLSQRKPPVRVKICTSPTPYIFYHQHIICHHNKNLGTLEEIVIYVYIYKQHILLHSTLCLKNILCPNFRPHLEATLGMMKCL